MLNFLHIQLIANQKFQFLILMTEYTTLNEPVMGTIIIHDTKEAPAVRLRSLDIKPGLI